MDSDRERLAELLSTAPGDIAASAREALAAGATFKLWPRASTATEFRSVFRRRQRNALRAGQPSIGFAEGLRDLGAYEGVFLALGYVDDRPQGGYYFQLFLTPDLSRLITCWGVKRSARAAAPAERVLDRRRLSGLGLERRSTADQELLLAMLAPLRPAEIPTLVVAALDAGAPCVIEVPVGTLRMRSSYARWQSVAQEAGWPSIGFPEGAGQPDAYDRPLGAFAHIDDHPRGGYYFQLFLTPDLSRLITGFGVKAAAERRA